MSERPTLDEWKAEGNGAFAAGDWQTASEAYTAALEIDSTSDVAAPLFSNRSATLIQLHEYDRALLDANRAIRIRPKWSKLQARRAEAYSYLQNFDFAKAGYEMAVELAEDEETRARYKLAAENLRKKV